MSWNPSAERKRKDQEVVGEDTLPRSHREQLDQNEFETPGARAWASEEAVRWARILALQVAIEDGSYRISAQEVAGSMFRYAERHHNAGLPMYSA